MMGRIPQKKQKQIHISFVSLVPFQSETHEPKVWHVKFLDVAFQRWPCYQHKLVEHPCSAHPGPATVDCILTYEQLILFHYIWNSEVNLFSLDIILQNS